MRMSTTHCRFMAVVWLFSLIAAPAGAEALKPFKDDLFSAQAVLESRDGGDFTLVDYQEMRDINARDQVPERRVKQRYVALGVRKAQADETLTLASGALAVTRTGMDGGQAFTVIFIHGRGGDRRLGANDFSFGGNFNRLKNLAVENGGTYYAPSVPSFDARGVAAIAGLVDYAAARAPGRPVILACASMGSFICSGISRDAAAVRNLSGMVILGGAPDPDFAASAFARAKRPVWFTHGSADSVYRADDQVAVYEAVWRTGQPARFTLFATGTHGTPVRMTDWRAVLNWLIAKG